MADMDFIKKMLKGSTTMPMGGGGAVHYHDGVACTHDHSHDHGADCGHDHSHDHGHHHHHDDGTCCDHDHSKDKK